MSPEREEVLRQLPLTVRKSVEAAFGESGAADSALGLLLDEIARLRGIGGGAASKSAVKSSDLGATYQVSQILPARRSVKIGFAQAGVTTLDPASGQRLEFGDWSTYNVLLKLPVPRRPKPQWNVVLAKLGGAGPFIVFSIADASHAAVAEAAKYAKYKDVDVPESRAVAAYVGAREGVLYLLDDFVFFGFKKPLTMVLLAEIESVSFTVVTSRTFNIVVQLLDEQTYEFEKISHDSYDAINRYIAEHQLNDESMAEARRAKKQRTEPTELEQAAKEFEASKSEEEEDELEEDYEDAGSDAGSGSGSDAGSNADPGSGSDSISDGVSGSEDEAAAHAA